MSYILQTFDLKKNFGKKAALQGLNMNVKKGAIYGFLGVNGAGKTTTISILGQFIQPSSGSFQIHGSLSILPQDARFYSGRKIGNQLAYLAQLSGVPKTEVKNEVQRVLKLVNLLDKIDTAAEKISHGMYKRLAIAQTLLGNPELLLLDEPTAGLDPETAFETRKMIKTLGKEKTVVISSHNLNEIAEMCDDVGIIHEGKMQFEGSTYEITKRASSLDIHLSKSFSLEIFENFPWLREKKLSEKENKEGFILTLSFDESHIELENVNALVIPLLINKGVGIQQILQGKSLEKGFLELIRNSSKE